MTIDRHIDFVAPIAQAKRPTRLSDCRDFDSVILLGDPGSGKSYIFECDAEATGAVLLRIGEFLSLPVDRIPKNAALYIDGLDEKRGAGREDAAISELISRLWVLSPSKLRISCRAADWLGAADLAAFKSLLASIGSFVVIALRPLDAAQQSAMLQSLGEENPASFLTQAEGRGIGTMLGNPQTLKMLWRLVQVSDWPSSKHELFREFVKLAMAEHNVERPPTALSNYTVDELLPTAGLMCAVRLLADIDGIAISTQQSNPRLPNYRQIARSASAIGLASLQRRLFLHLGERDGVDYVHRTVAEFVAGQHLANRLAAGLSLRRLKALLSVHNQPATELRGLFAWTAVHSPIAAADFLRADPLGVLQYADVSGLTLKQRRTLMVALEDLSGLNPACHSEIWDLTSSLAGLISSDVEDEVRAALTGSNASYRSLILKCLAAGKPPRSLGTHCQEVLQNDDITFADRQYALLALEALGAEGESLIVAAIDRVNDRRMRALILGRHYSKLSGRIGRVVEILTDAIKFGKGISGSLHPLEDAFPVEDTRQILNQFVEKLSGSALDSEANNATFDVHRLLERLVVCTIESMGESLEPSEVIAWLAALRTLNPFGTTSSDRMVGDALMSMPKLVRQIALKVLNDAIDEKHRVSFADYHEIQELCGRRVTPSVILSALLEILGDERRSTAGRQSIYAMCLSLASQGDEQTFWRLFDMGGEEGGLLAIRDQHSVCEIDEWRVQEGERRRAQAASKAQTRQRDRDNFSRATHLVLNGTHMGWLAYIARLYFSLFTDVNRSISPEGRLEEQLGGENARVAIEGLRALVLRNDDTVTLQAVLDRVGRNEYPYWWYAVVAGLDELSKSGSVLNVVSQPVLEAAVAIDCCLPTYTTVENVASRIKRQWIEDLWSNRPQVAASACVALARQGLEANAQHIPGLSELIAKGSGSRGISSHLADLLRAHPCTASYALQGMIFAALKWLPRELLCELCDNAMVNPNVIAVPRSHALWIGLYHVVSLSAECVLDSAMPSATSEELIWVCKDMLAQVRSDGAQKVPLSKVRDIAIYIASKFPNEYWPSGGDGWSGDRHPWDAAEAVRSAVGHIAASASAEATQILESLSEIGALSSYSQVIARAQAEHRTAIVDALYEHPPVETVINVLASACPTSARDLRAFVVDGLDDIKERLRFGNVDGYKRFWSEHASTGKPTTPKVEESCRDALIELIAPRLEACGFSVDPEGHMSIDKRCDIVVQKRGVKAVIECKRDRHRGVWDAIGEQLDRYYTNDPGTKGNGILVVFWFGEPSLVSKPPLGLSKPSNAEEMQLVLERHLPEGVARRIDVVVIDVGVPNKSAGARVSH